MWFWRSGARSGSTWIPECLCGSRRCLPSGSGGQAVCGAACGFRDMLRHQGMSLCPSTEQQRWSEWSQLQSEAPRPWGTSELPCGSAGSQELLCWVLPICVCPSRWFEPNVNVLEVLRLVVRAAHKGIGRNLGSFPVEENSTSPKVWEGLRATYLGDPFSLQPLILSELQTGTGTFPTPASVRGVFVCACSVGAKNPSARGADLSSDFHSVQGLIEVPPCCPLTWGGSRGPTMKRLHYLQPPFLSVHRLLSSLAALAEQTQGFPQPALLAVSG